MRFAPAIEFPELRKKLFISVFDPGQTGIYHDVAIDYGVQDPWNIRFQSMNPIVYRGFNFMFWGHVHRQHETNIEELCIDSISTVPYDAMPRSKKSDSIRDEIYEMVKSALEKARDLIVSALDDPDYLNRAANIKEFVVPQIDEKIELLVREVERLRKDISDGWFTDHIIGSTGSVANQGNRIIAAQAHLSACVEAWQLAYRPYFSAQSYAMLKVGELPFRVSLYL